MEGASTEAEAAESEDRWLVWQWVGPGAVTVLVAAVLVGAYVLTPGVPDCPLYTPAGLAPCPWYRLYARSVATLAGGLLVGSVLVGLAVEGVRGVVRRWRYR